MCETCRGIGACFISGSPRLGNVPDPNAWPMPRLLSTAARMLEHSWNEGLAVLGLTHAGLIALEILEARGPIPQNQIAALSRVQSQTMGKTLGRLEAHGHIKRHRGMPDGRTISVSITDAGREVLAEAREVERQLLVDDDDSVKLRPYLIEMITRLGSPRPRQALDPRGSGAGAIGGASFSKGASPEGGRVGQSGLGRSATAFGS